MMTDELLPQLESITPDSGCYLNEVNAPTQSPEEDGEEGENQEAPQFS